MTHYDVQFKRVFGAASAEIIQTLFGEKVTKRADASLFRGDVRFVDFLSYKESGGLLHIEFQATTPGEMSWRMLNYRLAIGFHSTRWKAPQTPIRQIVLYLRHKRLTAGNKIVEKDLSFDHEETTISMLVEGRIFDINRNSFHLNLMILLGADQNERNIQDKWRQLCRFACRTQGIEERSDRIIMLETLATLVGQRQFVRRELKNMPVTVNVRETVYGEEIYDSGYRNGYDIGRKIELERRLSRWVHRLNVAASALDDIKGLDVEEMVELEDQLSDGVEFWDAVRSLGIASAFTANGA